MGKVTKSIILYATSPEGKFTKDVRELFFDESRYLFIEVDYTKVKGTKWQLAKQILFPELVSEYDYVWLIDDDLYMKDFNPGKFIEIMEDYKLDIAQPSLTDNSYFSHRVTLKNGNGVRLTNFVEIMCPVYTKEAWLKFYPLIDVELNPDGWGHDFVQFKRMGIIDTYPIVHTRPCGNSYNRSIAEQNMIKWQEKYKITRPDIRELT